MPSTVIRRLAYREPERALDVEFVSGRIYRYLSVPATVVAGFAQVRSKGGYFNRAVRDRFRFVRLGAWQDAEDDTAGLLSRPGRRP